MAASEDRGNERSGGGGGGDEEGGGSSGGGWLTTYADMVTLMLTFFVMMLAMSSTDAAKVEMFMMAMSQDGITSEQFLEIQDKYNFEDVELDNWDDMWPMPGIAPDEPDEDKGGLAALQSLHDQMQQYIEEESLGEVISLEFNGDFLLITLASDILFESAMANITPEMLESVDYIARMLSATFEAEDPFEIVVAGHTDNIPINSPRYPSNWHLSRDRAVNYLYELVRISEVDPALFYARACGEYRPIATNETPEGRAKNRRVEVMISLARDNPMWDSGSHLDEYAPVAPIPAN